MYTNNREAYRQSFSQAWQLYQKNLALEPLQSQMVAVILEHPEYHALLENNAPQQEFSLEENPFFHMSLHLVIRDQIQINPKIKNIHQQLIQKYLVPHEVEHLMMTTLSQFLWQAQQNHSAPQEADYLEALQKL